MTLPINQNQKVVALCGSMKVLDFMVKTHQELERVGWKVYLPTLDEPTDYKTVLAAKRAVLKSGLIKAHLEKIRQSDCILVVNQTIGEKHHYIGANSFLEMGFAFSLGKPIYLLNDIPDQPNSDEIAGMLPIIIAGDLNLLGRYH